MRPLTRSQEWWARAERVIPLGTQTLSKSPTQFVQGVLPIYLQRGQGAHVWDVDGNEYIDYPMALGPVLLGYCEPAVDEAIRRQLGSGITFTLMHPLEVEVAERIVAMCPGLEAVRFGKTGSDAMSAGRARRPGPDGPRRRSRLWVPRLARLVHRFHHPKPGSAGECQRPDRHLRLQ